MIFYSCFSLSLLLFYSNYVFDQVLDLFIKKKKLIFIHTNFVYYCIWVMSIESRKRESYVNFYDFTTTTTIIYCVFRFNLDNWLSIN